MNRQAVDATIASLEGLGRIEPTDSALVALCRSAADALDAHPERASLVKEYRECLVLLAQVGQSDDGDAFTELFRDLDAGAEVGN